MLLLLPTDIIINIIFLVPIKLMNISHGLCNIINNNKNIIKYITNKYYTNFNLFNIIYKYDYVTLFKIIKTISYFFYSNLSINEMLFFKSFYNIHYKRFYWLDMSYKCLYSYINFYIMYYTINEFDNIMNSLNIYVENNMIINTNSKLNHFDYNLNLNIKHYLLYRDLNLKYVLIIKPDNKLDYSLYLLNKSIN